MHEATLCLNETSKAVAIKKLLAFFTALYMVLFDLDNNPVRKAEEVFSFYNGYGDTESQSLTSFPSLPCLLGLKIR